MASAAVPLDDLSVVDWNGGATPRAARDVAPRRALHVARSCANVSAMMLSPSHPARKYYAPIARFLDPTTDSGAWNTSRELAGALNDAGLTDQEVVARFPIAPALQRPDFVVGTDHSPIDLAVLSNELHMLDPWTGNEYGIAMVEKYASIPHACRPNCTLTFGQDGCAYLVSGAAPIAAGTPLTISKIQHQHGATLCVCMRASLMRQKAIGAGDDGECVCEACVETVSAEEVVVAAEAADAATKSTPRKCDPETCVLAAARAHRAASPTHARTVYEPTDYVSYLSQSARAMAALVAAWTADGNRIAFTPYALSRFALKLSLLGVDDVDDCSMTEVRAMYTELAAAITADTAANGGVQRILTPAGVIALATPPPPELSHVAAYENASRRVAAAVRDVLATHPWMGSRGEVHNFSPYLAARCPDNVHYIAKLDRANVEGRTMNADDLQAPPSTAAAAAGTAFTATARTAVDTATAPRVPDANTCAACSAAAKATCGRCGVWRYCSSLCQRTHWSSHRTLECRPALSDKIPAKLDMQTAVSAWVAWPLRATALRNFPRAGANVISSLMDRAGARAAATAGVEEAPEDIAARRDSAANGAAMLRFMNANCEARGCGTSDRSNLRACTKCALVFYCSDAHAKAHWVEHRVTCGLPDVSATDSAGDARHFFGTSSAH